MDDSSFPTTNEKLSRRQALTRLVGITILGSSLAWLEGCDPTDNLKPSLTGQFGSVLQVGVKTDFPAAQPANFQINRAGVFYHPNAKVYIIHLAKTTTFLLADSTLKDQLTKENILQDSDSSYWIALYQRCTHLGCTLPFRDDCVVFVCPCHQAHFHCDGEYLAGPAPRSMDRFPLSFQDEQVMVDTGTIISSVPHPDSTTRLLAVPPQSCS